MSYLASKSRLGLGYLDKVKNQKIAVLTPNGIKKFGFGWSQIEDITASNSNGMYYTSCENNFYGINNNNFNTCEIP